MTIIIIIATALGIRALVRASRQQPRLISVTRVSPSAPSAPSASASVAELNRRNREAERRVQESRKRREAEQQASADVAFYIGQIDRLQAMLWDADAALEKATERVRLDREQNRYGSAVGEKAVAAHLRDRDRAIKRVMMLENSVHAAEKKLNKAQAVLAAD